MDKNTNIIKLYNKITVQGLKGKAQKAIADKCGISAISVKQNWIRMENVPEKHQDDTIDVLQKVIKIQSEHIKNMKVNL